MKKVKVFLLLCLIMISMSLTSNASRKSFYGGMNLGVQTQRYDFKIRDTPGSLTHNVDATRLSPTVGLFAGWRTRFPNKFVLGLEAGASFFLSDVKRKINNSTTTYKVGRNFFAAEGALLLGYFLKQINTLLYLKLGAEYRRLAVEVTSQSTPVKLSENKNAIGFFPAMGVEIPLSNKFSLAAEGKISFYQKLKFKGNDSSDALTAEVTPRFESFYLRAIYQLGRR